ncbi:MAG: hypothetical protein IJT94_16445, partial [Oscillibacter sp.]|nr:hypothetical protein [Oscillibacter sp.]
ESVKKNGYALECWSLDWRGKTGSVTWDPIQALEEGETERERIPAPVMPAADVEASAVWEFSVENVRIEVYYQSVTDPLDAGSDGAPERTYKLYSVNSLSARDLLSTAANGVPAYYGQKTNADGTAVDSQGKPIDDCGRTSLAFATMKSLWDTIAETEKKDGQTEAARKVERYLLPAVMGGKLKLDDYHLRGWKSPDYLPPRQVYEQVITTPVQYRKWDGVEQANKDYFSDTPADSETITETVKEVGGIQVTTRTIARTVVSFRNEERGEGYYLKWTGKAVTGPMTLVESYDAEGSSGKCYSEVLRYDSAYTGRHLPYVDSAGELVFRLYYNRSLYQILFYYDANISSRDCVSWINSFANNTDYYERLSAYGDIKAYIDGTRADSPVCEYERCQFTVKKQNQTMYYYHNSTYTGESGVTSTRQFILESLYGAPLDHEHIWNGKSSNDFVWGQVNSGTYTAQLPLTIFNASDPEGINRVEYAYFGQDRDKGFVKAYVEDDDRGYGQPSSGLREEDFGPEGGLLTHLIAANIYPPAILSEDKSKEYAYVDGYEYWGYKRIPYNNDPASTEGAELKGWRGTSAIETDLQPLGINIANITTNAYWPDIYKNQPDPAAGTFSKLILYFQRKTYHIEYTNVEYGGTKHEEGDTYLYREPVERLPGLPALTAANCPYGNNYAFKGWYTSSSFAEETRVTDENGEFTNAFRANSGLFEADENGVYASAFRMPSYNLVLVARWEKAANTVTFHPCFPASGSSPAWTMTNLAADGTVPDEEFYLVADEQDRASHQALMGLLAERYGGDGMEYRDEAWYYVSGDAEWKFDGWYYYHG